MQQGIKYENNMIQYEVQKRQLNNSRSTTVDLNYWIEKAVYDDEIQRNNYDGEKCFVLLSMSVMSTVSICGITKPPRAEKNRASGC